MQEDTRAKETLDMKAWDDNPDAKIVPVTMTFVPYPDLALSLGILVKEHVAKQREDAWKLYNTLKTKKKGWDQLKICRMWEGYLPCLAWYYNVAHANCNRRMVPVGSHKPIDTSAMIINFPSWFGNQKLHQSHRSNLVALYDEYETLWFGAARTPKNLPFYWPL